MEKYEEGKLDRYISNSERFPRRGVKYLRSGNNVPGIVKLDCGVGTMRTDKSPLNQREASASSASYNHVIDASLST